MKKILLAILMLLPLTANAGFFDERTVTLRVTPGECVGTTNDPLCVFDTVVACAVRKNAELCKSVGIKYDDAFRAAFADLAGRDYKYNPVDMYVNRRDALCTYDDDRACATNPVTGKIERIGMSIKSNDNIGVYLRAEKNNKWSVIFATKYACWSDEDCT